MIGMRFGRLVVIAKDGPRGKCVVWLCKCDCGKEHRVLSHHLTAKEGVRSCGCLKESLRQGERITCKKCGFQKPIDLFYFKNGNNGTRHNLCIPCFREEQNEKCRIRLQDLRLDALRAYSNGIPICSCCEEMHVEFLDIDHRNGGGSKHRKEIGTGSTRFYRWLKRNGYPAGFRILCSNCNASFGRYGYCPHQEEPNGVKAVGKQAIPDSNRESNSKCLHVRGMPISAN